MSRATLSKFSVRRNGIKFSPHNVNSFPTRVFSSALIDCHEIAMLSDKANN